MLVLTRKETESFQIGPHILVTVVRIAGGRVRIGIDAAGTGDQSNRIVRAGSEAGDRGKLSGTGQAPLG